jgi:hypothetical protein
MTDIKPDPRPISVERVEAPPHETSRPGTKGRLAISFQGRRRQFTPPGLTHKNAKSKGEPEGNGA